MAEEKKEGGFSPECVRDIYNTLVDHNFALRAFGALLRSSDLTDFSSEAHRNDGPHNNDAKDLRYGLSQIIELYLGHQERVLAGYVDQYHKSDAWLVKRAADLISMVEQGAFLSREVASTNVREAISNLDIVINRDGELKEKAETLKAACLGHIKWLSGMEAVGG